MDFFFLNNKRRIETSWQIVPGYEQRGSYLNVEEEGPGSDSEYTPCPPQALTPRGSSCGLRGAHSTSLVGLAGQVCHQLLLSSENLQNQLGLEQVGPTPPTAPPRSRGLS